MKITNVSVFQVEGAPREGLALYETSRAGLAPNEVSPHRCVFTRIETDVGLTGWTYGGSAAVKEVGQLLVGEDPLRIEYLWEKLFYSAYHRLSVPVIALLGGPTRERIRAYAGILGFDTEPEAAARRSAEYVERGFTALKWYLPCNARDGQEGIRRNVGLIRAVRAAVGDEVDIMVDCLLSNPVPNSLNYAIDLARRLEEFRPTWLEEPLPFDDLDAHAKLARATRVPLAFGEHFYTRWQMRQLIESGAPTVLQPDPNAAGGITEMRKIVALASTYGVMVVPHANESCRNAVHLLFASSENVCPLAEWGVKINQNAQHFYADFYEPRDGYFYPPTGSGFGYELDERAILRRVEL